MQPASRSEDPAIATPIQQLGRAHDVADTDPLHIGWVNVRMGTLDRVFESRGQAFVHGYESDSSPLWDSTRQGEQWNNEPEV